MGIKMGMLSAIWCALLIGWANAETDFADWEDLEIHSKVAAAMPYHGFSLDIYELQRNQSMGDQKITYAYTPAVQLDHKSAYYRFNPVTNTHEVVLRISFWTDEIQQAVVQYIREELQLPHVKSSDVSVLRFNKAMLRSSRPKLYTLSRKWENYRQEKWMHFKLFCSSCYACQRVARLIRTSPDLFNSELQMAFTVSSKSSRTQSAVISAASISAGSLFSKLNQRFPKLDQVLLTADDTSQLISDSVQNVAAEYFDDTANAINPNSGIYNELRNVLIASTVTADKLDAVLWDSVFWNKDNYRPDKTTRAINDIYIKSDAESQKKLRELLKAGNEQVEGAEADVPMKTLCEQTRFSLATGFRSQEVVNKENEKKEMCKILTESRGYVEWQGEKFQPKPMLLTRVNIGAVRKRATFNEVKTYVTYATVGLQLDVKINSDFAIAEDPLAPLRAQLAKLSGPKITGPPGPPGIPGADGPDGPAGLPGPAAPSVPAADILKKIASLEASIVTENSQEAALISAAQHQGDALQEAIRMSIECALNNVVCRDVSTKSTNEVNLIKNIVSLKGHNVVCNNNEHLTRFQYVQPATKELRYDYKCCKFSAC